MVQTLCSVGEWLTLHLLWRAVSTIMAGEDKTYNDLLMHLLPDI